ncbi:MAG: thioredoxin family protein [Verrucomicrobiae bacterium]|nr:thioredoxin family protein [Verrucomicrobiae bacterium]
MKNLLILFLACGWLAPVVLAQSEWLVDHAQALEMAREKGKPVLMAFLDFGKQSQRMELEVLASSEFKQYASEKLLLLRLDVSTANGDEKRQRQIEKLAADYGVTSRPALLLAEKNGKILGKWVFGGEGAAVFIGRIEKALAGPAGEGAPGTLAADEEAFLKVMKNRCIRCHKRCGDVAELKRKGWIRPGQPGQSKICQVIGVSKNGDNYHDLSAQDKQVVDDYIKQTGQ